MTGGTSDVKEMTLEVIEVSDQIRPALEEKLGCPCATFEPKSFKSQLSNMLNIRQKMFALGVPNTKYSKSVKRW